ncbi:glutathione synthase [Nocardioides aromaticivorans]|uniref:Glutathione synthetase n=1 Tax=Nocardioides aromaticivorans TaxID=200618 RepID=A0A7Y9ZIL1_9ACTN|nr:glutathione synthase [Nocardioides aromaticivorans]NYI45546.1 glutathione synthase [Nocardioides aromaticivorans]
MSILVVADPWAGLDPSIDATVGLVAAAQDLGVAVRVCTPEDLSVVAGRVRATARPVTLGPRARGADHRWLVGTPWSRLGTPQVVDVADAVQLVLLRIDPPVDDRYLRTTHLLDLVESAGTRVVNRPAGVRALQEKLLALHFPELCPATLVTADPAEVRRFVAAHGAAVVKPVDGFGGLDVWLLRDDGAALALAQSATGGGRRHVVAQEYLAAVQEGNKRLFLLDGEVVCAVLRHPSPGDFRIDAPSAPAVVDDADRRIVAAIAPLLARHGVAMAGLDVIDGRLIEVNVTCPGGTAKADALLGTDLSGAYVRRLLHLESSTRQKVMAAS